MVMGAAVEGLETTPQWTSMSARKHMRKKSAERETGRDFTPALHSCRLRRSLSVDPSAGASIFRARSKWARAAGLGAFVLAAKWYALGRRYCHFAWHRG